MNGDLIGAMHALFAVLYEDHEPIVGDEMYTILENGDNFFDDRLKESKKKRLNNPVKRMVEIAATATSCVNVRMDDQLTRSWNARFNHIEVYQRQIGEKLEEFSLDVEFGDIVYWSLDVLHSKRGGIWVPIMDFQKLLFEIWNKYTAEFPLYRSMMVRRRHDFDNLRNHRRRDPGQRIAANIAASVQKWADYREVNTVSLIEGRGYHIHRCFGLVMDMKRLATTSFPYGPVNLVRLTEVQGRSDIEVYNCFG